MQYESYERRVAKVADFLKWLFKHKIKILILVSFMMLATLALLSARGIIVSSGECPSDIIYGEKLDYSANAFLSKTYYEYRSADGGEWTTEFPTAKGNYLVRAVAKATIGVRHGPIKEFTVLPKQITVKIAKRELVYGENPEILADLAFDDIVQCDEFIFDEEPIKGE